MNGSLTDWELAALLATARQGGDPQPMVDALPYARFLGLTVHREGAEIRTTMRYSDALIGDASLPALHGGTLAGLLESAAVFSVLFDETTMVLPKTITLTIDYLRSAKAVDTHCATRIVRRGKRMAVIESKAFQDDPEKPVATAIVHLLLASD